MKNIELWAKVNTEAARCSQRLNITRHVVNIEDCVGNASLAVRTIKRLWGRLRDSNGGVSTNEKATGNSRGNEDDRHIQGIVNAVFHSDLGSFDNQNGTEGSLQPPKHISKRYGKWHFLRATDPAWLAELQQVASSALEMFGYI